MNENIEVKYYAIHYIDKAAKKTSATIDLSNKVLKSDKFSITLIQEVHKAISDSPSLKNISFNDDEPNTFKNTLNDYFSTSSKKDFYTFTLSIKKLHEKIEKEFLAVGGYYLFIDYTVQKKRYISVVLLRKKAGLNIVKINNVYTLDNIENINIDKIAMAFRLNYQLYDSEENEKNYIALITTQQDGVVSNYFREWVNAGQYIKNTKNTENLIKIIKSIDLPTDDEGNFIYKTYGDFQKAVYEYAKPRGKRNINLKDIGKHFYGNENIILDYARDNGIIIDTEFKRDSSKWRTLVTIRAKIDGLELNVDYDKINDEDNGIILEQNRLIITSEDLLKQINKQYNDI